MTEVVITEHMNTEQLDAFNRKLYRPERGIVTSSTPEAAPDPVGYEVDDQQASFAAFAKFAGDG